MIEIESVWQKAPGVQQGLFGWAIATRTMNSSDGVAHAFRHGKGMGIALCGYKFPGKVQLPHERDRMCARCAKDARYITSLLSN